MEVAAEPKLEELTAFRRPEEIQAANTHIWPSFGSFDWWYRKNRERLQQAGAIVYINSRAFLHVSKTAAVAFDEGVRKAATVQVRK
jgi:hypothetical protein